MKITYLTDHLSRLPHYISHCLSSYLVLSLPPSLPSSFVSPSRFAISPSSTLSAGPASDFIYFYWPRAFYTFFTSLLKLLLLWLLLLLLLPLCFWLSLFCVAAIKIFMAKQIFVYSNSNKSSSNNNSNSNTRSNRSRKRNKIIIKNVPTNSRESVEKNTRKSEKLLIG